MLAPAQGYVVALAGLVVAAVLAGGGSGDQAIPWIGGAAVLLAAGAVAAALAGFVPFHRPGRAVSACVALLGAFVAWNGVTIVWSLAPDRSWSYLNRGVVYAAFLVAGLFAGALARRAPTLFAGAFALAVTAAAAWALAGKVFPALFPDGGRIARLREPVGYWNALALLLALMLPPALALAAGRRTRLRLGAAVVVNLVLVALLLTYSRGGLLVAVAVIVAWLAFGTDRLQSALLLAASAVPALAVAAWAFGQPGIASDNQHYATRAADGREFGIVLLLSAAAAVALAFLGVRLERSSVLERARGLPPRAWLGAATVAAVAAAVVAALAADPAALVETQAAEFANPQTQLLTQDPSRLTSLSSNNRWDWWREAWQLFLDEPVTGTGAASFAVAHRLVRDDPITVTEPHSLPLQFLSETGIVGALLAGGAAALALIAAVAAARRASEAERGVATALAIVLAGYLLHSLVDWNWDFLAVTAPVLAGSGVLFAHGRPPRPAAPRRFWAAATLVGASVLVSSLAAPWLAERRVSDAYDLLAEGRPDDAARSADAARSLNPLALEPLFVRADAQIVAGDVDGARRTLAAAVELQPLNPATWYELGLFELDVAGRPDAARRHLERARDLDPYGPAAAALESAPG